MKSEKMNRKKIVKDLEAGGNEYVISDGRVCFLSVNGYPVSLPENYYFKRKEELAKYFSGREEKDKKRLILENLGLLASPLPDREYTPKIEVVYQSNAVTVFKISGYSPDEDCKDIDHSQPFDIRENGNLNPWRTKRNYWISELAERVKKEIFGDN